jgi:hypothetical protein
MPLSVEVDGSHAPDSHQVSGSISFFFEFEIQNAVN